MTNNMQRAFGRTSICPKLMYVLGILILYMTTALAQAQIERLEPPHWWVGFEDTRLQLMLKGPNISNFEASIQNEKVRLLNVHKADSPNYLFLDLEIPADTPPGNIEIQIQGSQWNFFLSFLYFEKQT